MSFRRFLLIVVLKFYPKVYCVHDSQIFAFTDLFSLTNNQFCKDPRDIFVEKCTVSKVESVLSVP